MQQQRERGGLPWHAKKRKGHFRSSTLGPSLIHNSERYELCRPTIAQQALVRMLVKRSMRCRLQRRLEGGLVAAVATAAPHLASTVCLTGSLTGRVMLAPSRQPRPPLLTWAQQSFVLAGQSAAALRRDVTRLHVAWAWRAGLNGWAASDAIAPAVLAIREGGEPGAVVTTVVRGGVGVGAGMHGRNADQQELHGRH